MQLASMQGAMSQGSSANRKGNSESRHQYYQGGQVNKLIEQIGGSGVGNQAPNQRSQKSLLLLQQQQEQHIKQYYNQRE